MKNNRFFVLGTDTGVGKTVLSLLLMHYFSKKGANPFYIKPFQTGCSHPLDTDSDARMIYESFPPLKGKNPEDSMIYCLKNAKAPYFAARNQHNPMNIDTVLSFIHEKGKNHDPLIIEAAGGLLVPVTEKSLIIDLVQQSGARPIIAARAGLGTINHCLLSLEALRHRGIESPGLVFIQKDTDPTSLAMVKENMEAIAMFSDVQVAGLIPHIPDFSHPDPALFEVIHTLISQKA
ncbi:MAG: dethiobiotin synthase [Proteobacteria bacterium]|nr:dethiobiotin synthase [Pseudomonadota bacterium]